MLTRAPRLLVLGVFAPITGCFGICAPDPPSDPCEMDPLGCEGPDQLPVDPACTLEGPLEVAVGQGEDTFELLTSGDTIDLHYGGQGGQHAFLGVRVRNPAVDFPGLQIHFSVIAGPCDLDAACAWQTYASRMLVVTDPSLFTMKGAAIETTGYVVVFEGDPEWSIETAGWTRVVVRAIVKDRCGRVGEGVFSYVLGSGSMSSTSSSSSTGGTSSTTDTSDTSTTEGTTDPSTSDGSSSGA